MSANFDRDEVWKRLQSNKRREIGDFKIDQNIISGMGNIYKSEDLYPASDIPKDRFDRIWEILNPLMWNGVMNNGFIITVPRNLRKVDERNWMFRRRGRPCFRCGDRIEMITQGSLRRSTYFCPTCQSMV